MSVGDYYFQCVHGIVLKCIEAELNSRFSDDVIQILGGASALDPTNSFENFEVETLMKLTRLFSLDFTPNDQQEMEIELKTFQYHISENKRFQGLETFVDVSKALCIEQNNFPQLYKLVCLINVLPITSASAERTFSALKLVKTRLRTKMGDGWLVDLLILKIHGDLARQLKTEAIMERFSCQMGVDRRV